MVLEGYGIGQREMTYKREADVQTTQWEQRKGKKDDEPQGCPRRPEGKPERVGRSERPAVRLPVSNAMRSLMQSSGVMMVETPYRGVEEATTKIRKAV